MFLLLNKKIIFFYFCFFFTFFLNRSLYTFQFSSFRLFRVHSITSIVILHNTTQNACRASRNKKHSVNSTHFTLSECGIGECHENKNIHHFIITFYSITSHVNFIVYIRNQLAIVRRVVVSEGVCAVLCLCESIKIIDCVHTFFFHRPRLHLSYNRYICLQFIQFIYNLCPKIYYKI